MWHATVGELLDAEFSRMVTQSSDPLAASLRNGAGQAAFLRMSYSSYTKVRGGHQHLTHEQARRIAESLRHDRPESEREDLLRSLLAAGMDVGELDEVLAGDGIVSDPLVSAQRMFRYLARPGGIVVVEYRDLPRARKRERFESLAEAAGEAVAAGLCFAMVQPFPRPPSDDESPPRMPPPLHDYLRTHRREVGESMNFIASAAAHALLRRGVDPAAAKAQVRSRIALFERAELAAGETIGWIGLQSRTFWVETAFEGLNKDYGWFEWVAGEPHDHFVRRSERNSEGSAVPAQFEPIINSWIESGRRSLFETPQCWAAAAARMCGAAEGCVVAPPRFRVVEWSG